MARLTFERPTGWRLFYHRALQWIGAGVAAMAIAATLMPWHEVRDSDLGGALGCAFMPDCHVTPTPREVRMAAPPDAVHSGLQHGGVFLIGLLLPTTLALVLVGLADLASVAIVHLRRRGSDPVQVPPP